MHFLNRLQSPTSSVLLQLWQHTLELKANQWKLVAVPSYSEFFEAQLAACKPLELPELNVPLTPPAVASDLTLAEVSLRKLAVAYTAYSAVWNVFTRLSLLTHCCRFTEGRVNLNPFAESPGYAA